MKIAAVLDSTCLIGLERIGRLDLLTALLDPVLAPPTVIAHSPSTRFFMLSNCLGGDQISPD